MLRRLPAGSTIVCPSMVAVPRQLTWFRYRATTWSLQVTLLSFLVTLGHAFLPGDALAQQPPPGLVEVKEGIRRGFWFGAGIGAGGESYDFRDGSGYSNTYYQPTISLRAGGTVSPSLRLGGEILSWINDTGPAVESLSSLMFIAQYYPLGTAGLYLKGGLGVGRNAVNFDHGFDVGDTGFAGLLGAGYELRLGRRIYLNPVIDLVGHAYESRAGGSYRERLVHFGLGVLFQTGK